MFRAKSTSEEAMPVLIKPPIKENQQKQAPCPTTFCVGGLKIWSCAQRPGQKGQSLGRLFHLQGLRASVANECIPEGSPTYARALHGYCRCDDVSGRQMRAPSGHQPRKLHIGPCPLSQKPPHAPQLHARAGSTSAGVFGRRDALGLLGDHHLCFDSELVARLFQVGHQSH